MREATDAAEAAFTDRWLLRSLRLVNRALYDALEEQRSFFRQAEFVGEPEDIRVQGEALCRGWQEAVKAMEEAEAPHDAYLLGEHRALTVAIGELPAGDRRIRDIDGRRVVWLTPDEVARLWSGLQSLATVRELWPGSQVIRHDRHWDQPAQEDD